MFSTQEHDTEDSYNFEFANDKNVFGSYDESESRESFSTNDQSASFNNFSNHPNAYNSSAKINNSNSNPVRNSLQSSQDLLNKANSYLTKSRETKTIKKTFNEELDEDQISIDSDSSNDRNKVKKSFTKNKSFPSQPVDPMEEINGIGLEVKGIGESVYESYDEEDEDEESQDYRLQRNNFNHKLNKSENSIEYNEEFEEGDITEEIAEEYEESIAEDDHDEEYSQPPLNESIENASYSRIQYGNDETRSINEDDDDDDDDDVVQKPNILPFAGNFF